MIANIVAHIDRRQFRVTLAVIDMTEALNAKNIPDDVELIQLNANRVLTALPAIVRLIWTRRPDIVCSTLGHLNLAIAIVRKFLPPSTRTIAREASIPSFNYASSQFPQLWRMGYKIFYRLHDVVVCQSRAMRDDLVHNFGIAVEKTVIINNPIDREKIRYMAEDLTEFVDDTTSEVTFVAAGRLSEEKGFDVLISALALLDNVTVDVNLLGDGPLLKDLQELASVKGVESRIHFRGFQQNPYVWFSRADALVVSSRYEGFPNVVLEALACGTPVIALPGAGGTSEILAGLPSCFCASDMTPHALSVAMRNWMDSSRTPIAASAVDCYRVQRIIRQYEKLFVATLKC